MAGFRDGGPLDPIDDAGVSIKRAVYDEVFQEVLRGRHYVALCSPRQTGKTTMMYRLMQDLKKHECGTSFLYLGGLSGLSEERFYHHICKETETNLRDWPINEASGKPNLDGVCDQIGFIDYLRWLVKARRDCRRIVIFLDEVGGVPEKLSQGFWGGLRSVFHRKAGDLRRLMFILAGSLDMNHLATSNNSPLLNVCKSFSLDDFDNAETRVLYTAGMDAGEQFADAAYSWTSGHPYLSQKLGCLIEQHLKETSAGIGKPDAVVEQLAVDYFLDEGDVNLTHLYNHLKDNPHHLRLTKKILQGHRSRGSFRTKELEILGVLARGEDGYYKIRNRIYRRALERLFEDVDEDEAT